MKDSMCIVLSKSNINYLKKTNFMETTVDKKVNLSFCCGILRYYCVFWRDYLNKDVRSEGNERQNYISETKDKKEKGRRGLLRKPRKEEEEEETEESYSLLQTVVTDASQDKDGNFDEDDLRGRHESDKSRTDESGPGSEDFDFIFLEK
jgi:hypothetical protein